MFVGTAWISVMLSWCTLAAGGAQPQSRQQVKQWGRFEAAVVNPRTCANPYEDAALNVTYHDPEGRVVKFWGFYDGNGVWRIRFMPDTPGFWRYEASFSDGSPGPAGEFECVSSDIPGLIAVCADNPIWFGFKGGDAVLVRSLHVGDRFFADAGNPISGATWSSSQRTAFLDWAQRQGYNMLSMASHYLNRDSSGRGKGWNTPDLWDAKKQQPNPGAYQRMEHILDDLAARRIMVYPFAGFFGRDSDFPRDEEKQDLYLRYTLARLGPYWNVLFSVGGPEPRLKSKPYLSADEINGLGRRIKKLDVFGHLVSVHNPTGNDEFRDADWTSYGVVQGPKTVDRKRLNDGLLRNHHEAKPLYAQETLWPGNKHHPAYSADDIRKNAWVLMMSAAALNFGDMAGDSSSGFSGSMDLSAKVQQRHDIIKAVWDFFETVPFHRMRPRQDLVDNGYCLAEPGRQYLIYLEEPGVINLNLPGGVYCIKWINARDTRDTRDGGTATGVQPLVSPGGGDWLLHLTRVDKARESSRPGVVAAGVFLDIPVDRLTPDGSVTGRWKE